MTQALTCTDGRVNGSYSYVFNNAGVDESFGIASKILLDPIAPAGNSLEAPDSSQNGAPPTKDQMVTSFSSKSGLAVDLSTGNNYLTLPGYARQQQRQ